MNNITKSAIAIIVLAIAVAYGAHWVGRALDSTVAATVAPATALVQQAQPKAPAQQEWVAVDQYGRQGR